MLDLISIYKTYTITSLVLIGILSLNSCGGLGGNYYIFNDGAPLTGITYNNTIVVNSELVDYSNNDIFIIALQRLDPNLGLSTLEQQSYYSGKKFQYWIIDKINNKSYQSFDYNQYLRLRDSLNVPAKLVIDTLRHLSFD
jgi:hypothetical protein